MSASRWSFRLRAASGLAPLAVPQGYTSGVSFISSSSAIGQHRRNISRDVLVVVMFVWLLDTGMEGLAGLETLTWRASLAALLSFALALVFGRRLIAWLRLRFREPIACHLPQLHALHASKQATPTMGGLFIVAGIVAALLVFADLGNPYVTLALFVVIGLAIFGAADDLMKTVRKSRGLSASAKLAGQLLVAIVAALWLARIHAEHDTAAGLMIPLIGWRLDPAWLAMPLVVTVIVGSSNAVNLTDGLDGLAGGCLIATMTAVGAMTFAAGHPAWAEYLGMAHVHGAAELVVVAASVVGAVLGFLWFNCHPAQVFMGDTGALPLGGLLGLLAAIAKAELLLVIVAGVFVIEALSVLVQVGYFKCTQRRLLRCAPLHHHFQLLGWPEGKIVVRFWIAAALCAVLGLATLKISAQASIETAADDSKSSPSPIATRIDF